MEKISDLKPLVEIDNEELCSIFKCSTQGGMRRSHTTNSLVLVSNHVRSIYDDRKIDGIFHYTGMGKIGDQILNSTQNKTLANSRTNGVNVYLFEVFNEGVYVYIGPVKLVSDPYNETQLDEDEHPRKVWVFPLRPIEGDFPPIKSETIDKLYIKKEKLASKLSDMELRARAKLQKGKPGTRTTISIQQMRDIYVAEYAKRLAKGNCQLCHQPAPFNNPNTNEPHLESHHIIWLSKDGEDILDNTVALCPNCHRKMHIVNSLEDINHLKKLKDASEIES